MSIALPPGWTVLSLALQTATAPPPPPANPCPGLAEYRQLDFWVGEWDVRPRTAAPATKPSKSRIDRVEGQCAIAEFYESTTGYTGRSLNSYHPEKKHWEQFYVDNTGAIHHYVGRFRNGNLFYEASGVRAGGPGTPLARVRMTFFNQGPEGVRQLGEQSTDEGRTWTTAYDFVYRRRPVGSAGPGDTEAAAAVRAVAVGLVAADNARALDRVLAAYAPEAVLLPPHEPAVTGREALRRRYEALFARFDPAIEMEVDEVRTSGALAFVRGRNRGRLRARDGQPDRVLSDAFLMELAADASGRWLITHLMWHPDRQP